MTVESLVQAFADLVFDFAGHVFYGKQLAYDPEYVTRALLGVAPDPLLGLGDSRTQTLFFRGFVPRRWELVLGGARPYWEEPVLYYVVRAAQRLGRLQS